MERKYHQTALFKSGCYSLSLPHTPRTHTHAQIHQPYNTKMQWGNEGSAAAASVWQSDTGFGASPAFWYYIVCSGAAQKGLLQVWRLWMFQLSEFTDKPVGSTQWRVPFIRVQFNFTLSYITLSPRGRISHPILHLEEKRVMPPNNSSRFFIPISCFLLFISTGLKK